MGKRWQDKARYLQNAANTVFSQCAKRQGFDFDPEKEKEIMWDPGYPQDLWDRVNIRIRVQLMTYAPFSNEALGKIIGAGHPDYSAEDWLYAGDVLPTIEVGCNDQALELLATATLVAAKINWMRGKRP